MFWSAKRSQIRHALAQVEAMRKSQAMIELNVDGTIIAANEKFLDTMGYTLPEIEGKHHSIFVSPSYRSSAAYQEFWACLRSGVYHSGEFRRVGKNGQDVWIQGSYNPILDREGKPHKILKFCSDITKKKLRSLDDSSKVGAIDRSQAVVEFTLDGRIVSANSIFLDLFGYSSKEIEGKRHSMFVDASERESAAYKDFWDALNRGEYRAAEYKRIGKGGKELWILAIYNPILDETGQPTKVVTIASDVTEQKLRAADFSGQLDAIRKSQAVIEFDMDGMVLDANENFLDVLGYSLQEILGKHHSVFVVPAERESSSYRDFWAALRRGDFRSAEYVRIGKGGRQVWIQASYNPILDLNGKPYKVVKYATDTTTAVIARMKSERVRDMMESVAAGAEELNASVREISEAMAKSRSTAIAAVEKVELADSQVQRLSLAAKAMSGIVELIGNITGQINLLALNATIESARAGDAGRGFAVVASEVKSLADQAKYATDKISTEISGLNGVSNDVVQALLAIKTEIQNVSEYVTSTAAAVEEQSTVTSEMSSSMQRAAAEAGAA